MRGKLSLEVSVLRLARPMGSDPAITGRADEGHEYISSVDMGGDHDVDSSLFHLLIPHR